MFHYPSELSHWWGRRDGGSDRVAVERRDWPCFAANHRIVATCRILSLSVVIGRMTSSSAQGKKIDVPKPPRHFLISRGHSCGLGRIATERLLSRRCSSIPLQSMESFPESTVSRGLDPKWPGRQIRRSKNFIVPRPPRHFLYMRQREAPGWQSEKDFCPERPLPLPLSREGVFCAWIT